MKTQKRQSIKKQMLLVFIGLLALWVVALMVLNGRFLQPYYISNKKNQFVEVYRRLQLTAAQDKIKWQDIPDDLLRFAEKSNISFLIMGEDSQEVLTNVNDKEMLYNQLLGYLLNQTQKKGKVLARTDGYEINQSWDPWNKTDYVEMWGKLKSGQTFLIRSPLESIKESVAVSNRFLLLSGAALLGISAVFIWYFSKRLTDPIQELAVLSRRMADLDFEARYERGGKNEIAELGENFNRMSQSLKEAVAQLKSANNQLKQDIRRKEKLEEMRNEFLGNVSHELKTPLALIQGYAEGLKEGISEDADSRDFYCDVILDEAGKMNQMVRNLLTLNQLEFGSEETPFERFDLTELTRGVLQSMEILATQEGVQVTASLERPVYVWAEEFKVEQVIRNYISNAFHHVKGEKRVQVAIETTEENARVRVFNTGNPIPEEDLPHIWEKFYKVDKAHTREYGGNGIGLSIVKAIMDSFHQDFGVENMEDGVEFWFELDRK